MNNGFKKMGSEEELQNKIEAGIPGKNKDEVAYRLVFRALKKEIEFPLSDSFAERVMFLAREKHAIKSKSVFEYIYFAIGTLLIFAAFAFSVYLTGFTLQWGFLKNLSNYKGLFIMGTVLVVLFNVIDIKLIREKQLPQ